MTLASQNKVLLPKAGQFFQLTYVFFRGSPSFTVWLACRNAAIFIAIFFFVNDFQQEITFVSASYYHDGRNCSRPIQTKRMQTNNVKKSDSESEFCDLNSLYNRNLKKKRQKLKYGLKHKQIPI